MSSYIDTIKRQLIKENDLGVEEPYFVEISVRDARQAQDVIQDNPAFKNLVTYGSNVYATDDLELIQDLVDVLESYDIEILNSITEMSTTAGVPGFQTPYAFGKVSDKDIERLGYKKVKKPAKRVNESSYKKISKQIFINEIGYNEYKKDPVASPKQKINQSINYINRGLKEIEKVVNQNVRLKQEMGIDSSIYWKSSRENLAKISERLIRVSKQLKELSL